VQNQTQAETVYQRLGVRPFINARGTITTLGGSIMPPQVLEAMVEASKQFVPLNALLEEAGERIAALTGAEGAFICAGAASGMLLAGAAVLTGTDVEAIQALPDVGGRPNEFIISLVDGHTYIHQGFRLCGGKLVKVGTREAVTPEDYRAGISDRTAALVFFLGSQPREQLPPIIEIAHAHDVPVIVDAAAQLPPRANLTELTAMGADLVVFSGGKGLRGPQCTGLILGRKDLIRACALNSNPYSAIGRGMKVGKEEIAGLLTAVELFVEQDEAAVIRDWERRCLTIAEAARDVHGIRLEFRPPYSDRFPPASPSLQIHFSPNAPMTAAQVQQALEAGEPSILAGASPTSIRFGPQTLQDGEAEIIAARLREILRGT
jgi:L-seryl-tRNA(Ser) seleniumtransferase